MTYRKSIIAECYRAFRSDPLSPDYDRDENKDDACRICGENPCHCINCHECLDKRDQDDSIQYINPNF